MQVLITLISPYPAVGLQTGVSSWRPLKHFLSMLSWNKPLSMLQAFFIPLLIWLCTYQYKDPMVGSCPKIVIFICVSIALCKLSFSTQRPPIFLPAFTRFDYIFHFNDGNSSKILSFISIHWICYLHYLDLCTVQ